MKKHLIVFLLVVRVIGSSSLPKGYIEYLPDFVYTEEIKYFAYRTIVLQINNHLIKLQAQPPLLISQFNALFDFYSALNGPHWIWTNGSGVPWNFSDPNANPCFDNWQGITCDYKPSYCTVTGLSLKRHNLEGTIPMSVGNLSTLQILDLPHNRIQGQLPSTISALTALSVMDLGYNKLTGILTPSIGNLSSLLLLTMTMNDLTGLPEELYRLPKIQALNFFLNNLKGTISPSIGNLSGSLEHLNYGENELVGSIPATITNLTQLITLNLGFNLISQTLPNDLGRLSNISYLIISSSLLEGTIPVSLANMTSIRTFDLAHNHLIGTLPPEFSSFHHIENFLVQSSLLSGIIPDSYRNFHHIVSFFVEGNQFHGNIEFLEGMKTLRLTQISANLFSGNASVISTLSNLDLFHCSQNTLTGSLPVNPHWTNIREYVLDENYFSGSIPATLFNVTSLKYVIGDNNLLTGSLPNLKETFTRITELSLSNNTLTGSLPSSINQLTGITQLELNNNFLTGSIPATIGELKLLAVLGLAENTFDGTIPSRFQELINLEEVFIHQNNFKGSMDQFLNSSQQTQLSNVDLSNNQFTGTISGKFFTNTKRLLSFTASSNCFHGSIPEEICQASLLTSLALDGLSTATNCRVPLFTALPYFNSFSVERFLQGTIPTCLFNMSRLVVLHLSGNGFTGSFSNDLAIAANLTDLSLSHNLLSGDIPKSIQEKYPWTNLDLSYNKFGGSLLTNIASFPRNSSLTLEVNRLSGRIPSSLLDLESISILEGNIFTCNVRETDLPKHDDNVDTYSCGSDNVNYVLYAWIVMLLIILLIFIYILVRQGTIVNSSLLPDWFRNFQERRDRLISESEPQASGRKRLSSNKRLIHIQRLFFFFQEIRWIFILLTVYCMVVLLPVYGTLTFYTASYRYKYAWTISGMLLRGEAAGIVLYLSLTAFIGLVIFLLRRMIHKMQSLPDYHPDEKRNSHLSVISDKWWEVSLVYGCIALVNVAVMAVSDFSYVYVVVYYGYTIVTISAFALAIFRLGSNNILLNYAIPLSMKGWRLLRQYCWSKVSESNSNRDLSIKEITLRYSWKDLAFLENIILFNNIVIPTLAVIFVLPDCFFNALFAPDSVTSSYTYINCNGYYARQNLCGLETESTEYSPPFIYSYQCSSKIVINYVSVFILMFIFTGILVPTFYWLVSIYYHRFRSHPLDYGFTDRIKSVPGDHVAAPSPSVHKVSIPSQSQSRQMSLRRLSLANTYDSLFLLELLKPLTPTPRTEPSPMLFRKLRLTVRLNSYLAILISFGALFPPLAFIACVSVLVITYFEEVLLYRVLSESRRLGYSWYEEQIERECEGVESSLMLTVWSSMFVSCCLFAYIIFDTIGDTEGWDAALPVMLLMAMTPVLLYFSTKLYDYMRNHSIKNQGEELQKAELGSDQRDELGRESCVEMSFRESSEKPGKSSHSNSSIRHFDNPLYKPRSLPKPVANV